MVVSRRKSRRALNARAAGLRLSDSIAALKRFPWKALCAGRQTRLYGFASINSRPCPPHWGVVPRCASQTPASPARPCGAAGPLRRPGVTAATASARGPWWAVVDGGQQLRLQAVCRVLRRAPACQHSGLTNCGRRRGVGGGIRPLRLWPALALHIDLSRAVSLSATLSALSQCLCGRDKLAGRTDDGVPARGGFFVFH